MVLEEGKQEEQEKVQEAAALEEIKQEAEREGPRGFCP